MHDRDPMQQNQLQLHSQIDGPPPVAPRIALGGLIAAAIIALMFAFWPSSEPRTPVTDKGPAYRASVSSTAPPASPN